MKTIYCDFQCKHAAFPEAEMLGACRTMSGVYCRLLGRVVAKHAPCQVKADGERRGKKKGKERRGAGG